MSFLLIKLIKFYQYVLSPDKNVFFRHRTNCVFYPTCSDYTIEAIKKYGSAKGVYLGFRRVLRCHPWQEPTVDKP